MKFLIWFVVETFLFFKLADLYGFFNVAFWYFIPSLVGIYCLQFFGLKAAQESQQIFNFQKTPDKNILHQVLKSIGSLLLIIPTFTTRFFGVLFLTPGLRHLIVWFGLFKGLKFLSKSFGKSGPLGSFFIYTNWPNQRGQSNPSAYNNSNPDSRFKDNEVFIDINQKSTFSDDNFENDNEINSSVDFNDLKDVTPTKKKD